MDGLTHEQYAVGWLCALKCEFNAARMLLDEIHKTLAGARGDDNSYLLGRMKGHNIVIARVGKGTNAAAHAAANLLRSFPNIRFGLMVGIGGGAPSAPNTSDPRKDIRLGDVVVSEAEKGHGGVVQYDRGRRKHDGALVIESHLNKPPPILSQAVGRLQSDHDFEDGEMGEYISEAATQATQRPTLSDYRFPGRDRDLLFNSAYPHAGGDDCSTCDVGQLCTRLDRQSSDPVVHYGLIGSSNTVMKSAQSRDTLRADWNVICFETEAAGLMDNFPCVVVRGISDYSDDHKHDGWQPYAAVVAAAYAKDLLRVITPEQVGTMDMPVREVTRRLDGLQDQVQQGFSQTHGHVETLLDEQEQRKMAEALDWLCATDYGSQQTDNLEKRHPGTGQWLLESAELRRFLDEDRQTLLCTGMPGAGKTILASIVVDHLLTRCDHDPSIAVAYVYCSYQRSNDQSAHHMLASLLKQISLKRCSLPDTVKALHLRHRRQGTRPSLHEISTALQSVATSYSRVFIIIDALDECQKPDGPLSTFLSEMVSLQKRVKASILATSRFIPRNTDAFDGFPVLQVRADESDLCKYVDGQMFRLPEFIASCPELQDEIKAAVTKAANGMFLLAQFHVDSLVGEKSDRSIRAALESLPTGSGAISKTYDLAMERVEAQIGKSPLLAKEVLAWLTCARRTLTTKELQHALATEVGESKLHEDNLPQLNDLVSVCRGLVTVDHESQVIRLAHYTTQEYFERTQKRWFPDAHDAITDVCATYLSFDMFASGRCAYSSAVERRLEHSPLYLYAAYNWGYHASLSSACPDSVIEFLQKPAQTDAASQILFATFMTLPHMLYAPYLRGRHLLDFNMDSIEYHGDEPMEATGLHLAAYLGVTGAVQIFRDTININAQDVRGRTPLSYAAESGRVGAVELLLERNADLHLPDSEGITPLIFSARGGFQKTLQLLVNRGANVNSTDDRGRTPLILAASMDYCSVIQILVDNGASLHPVDHLGNTCLKWAVFKNCPEAALMLLRKDPGATTHPGGWLPVINWVIERGHRSLLSVLIEQGLANDSEAHTGHRRSAMLKAAAHGDQAAVKLLLAVGATVNPDGIAEASPLSLAALNGHQDMVCLLLENGARVSQELPYGRTPLVSAVRSGNAGTVKVLLDHGADIDVEDGNHWTPLSHAIHSGDLAIAKLLLGNGANPDFMGTNGRSLLMSAVADGDKHVVILLLKYGADIEMQDTNGHAALSYAIRKHRLEMARLLLQKGANCEARDRNGQTPLIQAVVEQQEGIVRLLLNHGAQNDAQDVHGRTSLWHATGQGNQTIVKLLQNDTLLNLSDEDGYTPLAKAIMGGHMNVAKLLLESHEDSILIHADHGEAFLAWAAKNGDSPVVQTLLRKGISPNVRSQHGQTPLCLAAIEGHIAVVRLLLTGHAHPDAADSLGQTPVLRAATKGYHSIIEELLKFGASINSTERHGQTPLMQAAKHGHDRVVRLLLQNHAEVDNADQDHQTALLHAAKGGQNAVIKLLLSHKANVNLADQQGRSPVSWASMHGHDTTIEMLLQHGATADHKDRSHKTPLAMAALKGHASTVQLLLGRDVDIEAEDESGRTPLFWAVYWNSIASTRVLLARGADPRRLDRNNRTPLAWAVERGQTTMVGLFLQHDETLLHQDEYGTPLLLRAARHGHADVVQLLLDQGQDVDLIDLEHGRSALWYAADGGYPDVVRLLLASNATIDLPDNDSRTPLARALAQGHRAVVDLLAKHTKGRLEN